MIDITSLNGEQIKLYNAFLLLMKEMEYKKKIYPVYRGDSYRHMQQRLGAIDNYEDFLDKLFMMGDKARLLYDEPLVNNHHNRHFRLNQTDQEVFSDLFDSLQRSTFDPYPHKQKYFNENRTFADFFRNNNNKKLFLAKAGELSESERQKVKRYYTILLHRLSTIKDRSPLISTSTSLTAATGFARNQENRGQIVLYAWTLGNGFLDVKKILKTYNLPEYKGLPFGHQQEISLHGGLFPHFIFGIKVLDDDSFFLNPYLFDTPINEDLFYTGFHIDQTRFMEFYHNSGFRRYMQALNGDPDNIIERT